MKTTTLFIVSLLFAASLAAQRFETKDLGFRYVQYPSIPVKGVDNYNSTVLLDYEQKNQALRTAYDQEVAMHEANYQQAMQNYQMELNAAENEYKAAAVKYLEEEAKAEAIYQQAMRVYNRAGGANSNLVPPTKLQVVKPVKRQVMIPSKMQATEPYYLKVYDTEKIKNNHINVAGLKAVNENALQIIVTLKGFEKGNAQVKGKTTKSKNSNGETVSTTVYYGAVQGKHAVHIQVITPTGEMIMDEIAVGSGGFSTKNTKQFKTRQEAQNLINQSSFLRAYEDELMRKNMQKVGNMLDNRFGYPIKSRKAYVRLFYHKKMSYPEYQTAYENVLLAYPKLNDLGQRAEVLQYASKAIESWENAMRESAPDDKKARINKKVSRFTCLMLAEAHMWSDNFAKAEEYIAKMKVLKPLVNERKWLGSLERLLASRKKRITAYNQAH